MIPRLNARGNKKKGTTIIELIVYIAIFSVTVVYVMFSVVQLAQVYGKARAERKVLTAAEGALERLVRETRLANSHIVVPTTIAVLSTQLSHTDTTPVNKWVMYAAADRRLDFYNGTTWQALTPKDVRVTAFTVSALPTPAVGNPKAIRFTMTVEAGQGKYYTSRTYAAMATLRESY